MFLYPSTFVGNSIENVNYVAMKKIATKEGYDNNSKVDNEKKGVFACLM